MRDHVGSLQRVLKFHICKSDDGIRCTQIDYTTQRETSSLSEKVVVTANLEFLPSSSLFIYHSKTSRSQPPVFWSTVVDFSGIFRSILWADTPTTNCNCNYPTTYLPFAIVARLHHPSRPITICR